MEYTFISRKNLPVSKQEKALINLDLVNKIKEILLNPKDHSICNKNMCDWAKKRFKLEDQNNSRGL